MSDITKYIKHVEIRSFDRGGFGQVHEADFVPEGADSVGCKVSLIALLYFLVHLTRISLGRR